MSRPQPRRMSPRIMSQSRKPSWTNVLSRSCHCLRVSAGRQPLRLGGLGRGDARAARPPGTPSSAPRSRRSKRTRPPSGARAVGEHLDVQRSRSERPAVWKNGSSMSRGRSTDPEVVPSGRRAQFRAADIRRVMSAGFDVPVGGILSCVATVKQLRCRTRLCRRRRPRGGTTSAERNYASHLSYSSIASAARWQSGGSPAGNVSASTAVGRRLGAPAARRSAGAAHRHASARSSHDGIFRQRRATVSAALPVRGHSFVELHSSGPVPDPARLQPGSPSGNDRCSRTSTLVVDHRRLVDGCCRRETAGPVARSGAAVATNTKTVPAAFAATDGRRNRAIRRMPASPSSNHLRGVDHRRRRVPYAPAKPGGCARRWRRADRNHS